MKIAYFGYNAFSSCLDLLVRRGHEVVCIYSGESSVHTDRVIRFAELNQIPLCFDKPDQQQMDALVRSGVDIFLSAEYPWKIPVPEQLKYAINIHPTMLPEGRGPTPLPSLILNYPQHAGITFHKMINKFETGILILKTKSQHGPKTLIIKLSFGNLMALVVLKPWKINPFNFWMFF